MASDNPLDPAHLFGHVQDARYFEVPRFLSRMLQGRDDGRLFLPQPFANVSVGPDGQPLIDHYGQPVIEPVWHTRTGIGMIDRVIDFKPLDLTVTKFMVLEVIVAVLLCLLFISLAQWMKGGGRPRGVIWNMFESVLIYLRDYVARPAIGSHDYHRFLPLIWTVFFFVLACNLIGAVPWMGTPTSALAVTAALAMVTFATVLASGMGKLGPVGFWKAQVPHMDLPKPVAIFLIPMIFAIEILGLLIKHVVLAVRLFANMTGGHVVIAVLMAFIAATAGSLIWWGIAPASVLGATAVGLLEILVAFIQAYIFTFLTALFIGMAVHPH